MKVYIAFEGEYSARGVVAVFSDKTKAEECSGDVEEHELDELAAHTMRPVYEVRLRISGGDVVASVKRMEFGPPNYCRSETIARMTNQPVAMGQSSTSESHALKLAAEARQAFLRECSLVA